MNFFFFFTHKDTNLFSARVLSKHPSARRGLQIMFRDRKRFSNVLFCARTRTYVLMRTGFILARRVRKTTVFSYFLFFFGSRDYNIITRYGRRSRKISRTPGPGANVRLVSNGFDDFSDGNTVGKIRLLLCSTYVTWATVTYRDDWINVSCSEFNYVERFKLRVFLLYKIERCSCVSISKRDF